MSELLQSHIALPISITLQIELKLSVQGWKTIDDAKYITGADHFQTESLEDILEMIPVFLVIQAVLWRVNITEVLNRRFAHLPVHEGTRSFCGLVFLYKQ